MEYEVLNISDQVEFVDGQEIAFLAVHVLYSEDKKSTNVVLKLERSLTDEEVNQAIVAEGLKVKQIFAGEPERNIIMSGQIS